MSGVSLQNLTASSQTSWFLLLTYPFLPVSSCLHITFNAIISLHEKKKKKNPSLVSHRLLEWQNLRQTFKAPQCDLKALWPCPSTLFPVHIHLDCNPLGLLTAPYASPCPLSYHLEMPLFLFCLCLVQSYPCLMPKPQSLFCLMIYMICFPVPLISGSTGGTDHILTGIILYESLS